MSQFSKYVRNRSLLLGYYQIAGGLIGIGLVTWLLFSLSSFDTLLLVVIVPAFILFLFSMYCGSLLIRRRRRGVSLSLVNQYLQLLSFAAGGYAYQYVSGLYFTFGIDLTESFTFSFGVGVSSWKLNINTGDTLLQFSFNFMAVIVILMLLRLKNRISSEQELNLFEEPGQQPVN